MTKKFKVAVVGCGVISGNHIPSLSRLDCVKIVALCDIDKSKADSRKKQFNLSCPIYDDYLTMLNEVTPDCVHILTPHHLHTDMTLEALKRDINVLLEKPTCIKAEDLEKLIAAEQNSKGRVCVSFQTRYNETVSRAREIAGADGGAKFAFATVIWNRSNEYYASGDWRGKLATEGGGALINQAIHTIDLLCIFFGKPTKVQANVLKMRHCDDVEVEDTCSLIIDFESGKSVNLFVSTTYTGQDTTTLHIETENHRIEIINSNLYLDSKKLSIKKPSAYLGKKCYGNSHMILIEKFYDSLTNGAEVPISLESSSDAMKIVFGAYKSNSKIMNI